MPETVKGVYTGLALSGSLKADASVDDADDANALVTVTCGGYTIKFARPDQQTHFQGKHTRRIRSNSVTDLNAGKGEAAKKVAQYAQEASKAAGQRWQNVEKRTNTLLFLTLEGFCKLGAYIVDQSAGRTWHLYPAGAANAREQVDLMFTMNECLTFSENGFGQGVNTGVGVRLSVTVEKDPTNDKVLYVVHLAGADAKTKLDADTLSELKNAAGIAANLTKIGGDLMSR